MRKTNNSIKILSKELCRRGFVILLLIGSALYLVRSSIADLSGFAICYSDISSLLSIISYFISVLVFLNLSVFGFLAYLLAKQVRIKDVEETISAIPSGTNRIIKDQFLVLLLLGLVVTTFSLLVLVITFHQPLFLIIHEYPLFVGNLVISCIVYSGLSMLLGILVGATGAQIKNDLVFFLCYRLMRARRMNLPWALMARNQRLWWAMRRKRCQTKRWTRP